MIGATAARLFLALSLIPFLFFAVRDQILHFSARRVPLVENVIHLALGIVLTAVIDRAFRFDRSFFAIGVVVFAAIGALDEFIFHRRIPESESDVHAKEHFALLAFVAVFWAVTTWRS